MNYKSLIQLSTLLMCLSLQAAATPSLRPSVGKTPFFMSGSPDAPTPTDPSTSPETTPIQPAIDTTSPAAPRSVPAQPNPATSTPPISTALIIPNPATLGTTATPTTTPSPEQKPENMVNQIQDVMHTFETPHPTATPTTSTTLPSSAPSIITPTPGMAMSTPANQTPEKNVPAANPMQDVMHAFETPHPATVLSMPNNTPNEAQPMPAETPTMPTPDTMMTSMPMINNMVSDQTTPEKTIMPEENADEDQENNENIEEIEEEIPNQTIILMNSTGELLTVYGQIQGEETCLAQNLGPIAQIVIPGSTEILRFSNQDESASEQIENNDLTILTIQTSSHPDATEKIYVITSIQEQSEQGVMIYNTTTEDQEVKATYPHESTFFYTPRLYYKIPALSVRFMTLPTINKKGNFSDIHLSLSHSHHKIIIKNSTDEKMCVIYKDDTMTRMDDITADFN